MNGWRWAGIESEMEKHVWEWETTWDKQLHILTRNELPYRGLFDNQFKVTSNFTSSYFRQKTFEFKTPIDKMANSWLWWL